MVDLSRYHGAELVSLSVDRFEETFRLTFSNRNRPVDTVVALDLFSFRVERMKMKNILRIAWAVSGELFDERLHGDWLRWVLSRRDVDFWFNSEDVLKYVKMCQAGELHLAVFEPSEGAQVAFLSREIGFESPVPGIIGNPACEG